MLYFYNNPKIQEKEFKYKQYFINITFIVLVEFEICVRLNGTHEQFDGNMLVVCNRVGRCLFISIILSNAS
jgi:hypothetical protein